MVLEAGPRLAQTPRVFSLAYTEQYLDCVWPCLPESTGMLLPNAAIVEIGLSTRPVHVVLTLCHILR